MFLSVVAILAIALLSSAFAQSSTTASSSQSSSATATSTSAAVGATHTCSVGADGFNFTPNQINATVGDVIEFRFYPQNHSVARAGYKNPCIPYEDTGIGLVGFWSGFEPVAVVLSNPPIFRLPINDTEPVFFYCSAPGACFQGMIGVINPNSTFTFDTQFLYSQNATEEFSPMEYFPSEGLPTRTTTATGATAIPTAATSTTTAATASSNSSSLSGGAIAGIAIGAAVVVLLAGALIYMCGRQKSLGEIIRHSQAPPTHHNSYLPGSTGMSEANYPNVHKQGHASVMSGQYSDQGGYHGPGTETESYRSMSPPIDERTGMMSLNQHAMHLRNGQPSPGSPGSAAFPSPGYSTYATGQTHEIDQTGGGLMPAYTEQPERQDGPHELSGTGPSPTDANSPRPFSFTDSESGYRPDQKIDPMIR